MKICRFPIPIQMGTPAVVPIPPTAMVRHFAIRQGMPTIWVELDETWEADIIRWHFMIYGEGESIPGFAVYIATAQDGPNLWHLYRVQP